MQAVILAGGLGTRIAHIGARQPKPMLPVLGKPVLEHQIECLRYNGCTDILLIIGHLGDAIKQYFGDGSGVSPITGIPFGVHIRYFNEKTPLGTGGALYELKGQLENDFLLANGDVIFDIYLERFFAFHKKHSGLATVLVHPSTHPADSALLVIGDGDKILQWAPPKNETVWYRNCVNSGLHILSRRLVQSIPSPGPRNLDRDILKPLTDTGELHAYYSTEYVHDMGTELRYRETERDMRAGLPAIRNLRNRQRAVFLDRDGTINKPCGFISHPSSLELLPDVGNAIRDINKSGYLAIVVSNQPVVARGEASEETLAQIHNKMEILLGEHGAYLDAIYYCPHHPDKGFVGERTELKVVCDCRKPKPGLLLQARDERTIDLSASWMVGDSEADMQAGIAAGCKVARINSIGTVGRVQTTIPNYKTLNDFVKQLPKLTD